MPVNMNTHAIRYDQFHSPQTTDDHHDHNNNNNNNNTTTTNNNSHSHNTTTANTYNNDNTAYNYQPHQRPHAQPTGHTQRTHHLSRLRRLRHLRVRPTAHLIKLILSFSLITLPLFSLIIALHKVDAAAHPTTFFKLAFLATVHLVWSLTVVLDFFLPEIWRVTVVLVEGQSRWRATWIVAHWFIVAGLALPVSDTVARALVCV